MTQETRRTNPRERRMNMPSDLPDDCENSCGIVNRLTVRVDALGARIDEERKERQSIKSGVQPQTFFWIVALVIGIYSTLLSIMWYHFSAKCVLMETTVTKIQVNVAENTGKVDVVVARINEFMKAHEKLMESFSQEQNRTLMKLDYLTSSIQDLRVSVGKLEGDIGLRKVR